MVLLSKYGFSFMNFLGSFSCAISTSKTGFQNTYWASHCVSKGENVQHYLRKTYPTNARAEIPIIIPIWTQSEIKAAIPKLIAAPIVWNIFHFFYL